MGLDLLTAWLIYIADLDRRCEPVVIRGEEFSGKCIIIERRQKFKCRVLEFTDHMGRRHEYILCNWEEGVEA